MNILSTSYLVWLTLASTLAHSVVTSTLLATVFSYTLAATAMASSLVAENSASTLMATNSANPLVSTTTNLTIGYLANMHGSHRQGHLISGAMTYAVKQVNDGKVLPEGYVLEFTYADTKGETLNATRALIAMWNKGVVAFIGPENSCEVEATVSASLNLPMISYKCADSADKDDLASKDYRDHFARTYPPNTKVTSSVLELLRYYKWYKFSIVYERSEMYETVFRSLEKNIRPPFHINHRVGFHNTRECCIAGEMKVDCCLHTFTGIVQNTSADTRIYVFLGDVNDLSNILVALQMRGLLATGNYIVLYIDMESYGEEDALKYFRPQDERAYDLVMRSAQSLLVLVATPPRGHRYEHFAEQVRRYNSHPPFLIPQPPWDEEMGFKVNTVITPYASYLYDAVTLYADALSKALRNHTDPRNGKEIMRVFRERSQYTSVTGAIMRIDKDGGAEGNYTVLSWQPKPNNLKLRRMRGQSESLYCMLPVGRFYALDHGDMRFRVDKDKDILWVNFDKPPVDEPPCGFDGKGCSASPDKTKEYIAGALLSALVLSSFLIYMVYRNWTYEQEIDGLLWRLQLEEIQRCGQNGMAHSASRMSLVSHASIESRLLEQVFTKTAVFRGAVVALKQLHFSRRIVDVSRKTKKEMKAMREMHHDNINQFIGACVDPNCVQIVSEYCSKGSLQDILENDDIKLDNMFISSLVFDLIKGMLFLHASELRVHGNLKSSNCVVSSRWVLQITDFGLHELRAAADSTSTADHQYFRNLLWKAPEFLRCPSESPFGTQKGDVYAFGIILHEIIARQGPFGSMQLAPKDIVHRVKQGAGASGEVLRPPLLEVQCQDYVVDAMRDAWCERPDARPDFQTLREKLRKMRDGLKSNIMDNMMSMMEKYAYNLEELVEERTHALQEEKKITESLLHRMLPKSVANQLMRGESVIPESFDAVTIYFSDIVGFTEMSASSTPMEVVTFLNELYTVFDDIISHYDVYKIETIGDAYMVVSGLPIRNGDTHAAHVASMALELVESIRAFRIRHKPGQTLKLRVGVHTGPVCAGVVGLTMPRYCLFGDTVNTASRMESNGEALKIHISPQCKEYLDKLGGYHTEDRGLVKMKGKGEVNTFWLVGEEKGVSKRRTASESLPPLFAQTNSNTPEFRSARRNSPKLPDSRRNSSFVTSEEPPPSPGVPVFLRLATEAGPRSPKRLSSFGRGDPAKLLRVRESNGWYGSNASSCSELHTVDISLEQQEAEVSRPKPKLESICSEEQDISRNGLLSVDESMRPLLSMDRMIDDSIRPIDQSKVELDKQQSSQFLKPPVLKMPSKKWRSCDEIILPKGSRNSLKEFFTGLLQGGKNHEETKRANNIPMARMTQDYVKEESLV